jgi:DNA-binding transcriptional ArsR family regulator
MRTVTHPAPEQLKLTTVLAALADPTRLAAVRTLSRLGSASVHQLQHDAGIDTTGSTFSHHQKVLREAGIVHVTMRGSQRILTLRWEDLEAAFPGLLSAVVSTAAVPAAC